MDNLKELLPGFQYADVARREVEQNRFRRVSTPKEMWQHFSANKGSVIGLIFVALMVLLAIFGPYFNQYAFDATELARQNLPPRIPGLEKLGIFDGVKNGVDVYAKQGYSDCYFWFGTDALGRDLFTRFCEGTRVSLIVAVVAAAIEMTIGITYGMVSGYCGGNIDIVMQRITELISGIPSLVIVILLLIVMKPGLTTIIVALAISEWLGMSRLVRAQTFKLKEMEYVLAARTLGESMWKILFAEILPNLMGNVIVMGMMSIPSAIFMESFLSFIGLGIPAPQASLGSLINSGYSMMLSAPYQLIIPTTLFTLLMISLNLIADGLRDAIDPQQKTV